jgi:hypothetical protein
MIKSILITLSIFFILACKKDLHDNSNNSQDPKTGITIKGNISGSKSMKIPNAKSTNSFSLADAKKVLIFSPGNKADISFVNIINGSFTASPRKGSATALVFLDPNDRYIGTLSTRGLNLLPLGTLINGDTTTIDLSTLTLAGSSVIPSHDPFGKEILITDTEINGFKELGIYFESLAKNIDADNDGVLDVLSNKQIYIISQFLIFAGTYGINNKPAVINGTALTTIGYNTYINGDLGFVTPSKISLSGPEGDPYDTIYTGHLQSWDNNGHGFSSGFGMGDAPFKKGIYDLTLDNKTVTLSFSNIGAKYNLVFVTPTLNTNSDGKLVSIALTYQHPDYTSVNPENILTDVMIQLNDSTSHQFYNSPWLNRLNGCHDNNCVEGLNSLILNSPLDISSLRYIDIVYHDILGNLYFIQWRK